MKVRITGRHGGSIKIGTVMEIDEDGYVYHLNGRRYVPLIEFEGRYSYEIFTEETPLQKHLRIFMEDNDLKDGEKFNLTFRGGGISRYNPFYIKNGNIFSNDSKSSNEYLGAIITGTIEKIDAQKQSTIQAIEQKIAELKEEVEKLKNN